LAELVKIDPKSIGVGQYQHDVDQKRLRQSLGETVESCVNHVGVDVNTASASLLQYVSGLTMRQAENVIAHRNTQGRFTNRQRFMQVSGLGEKTFQQAAGFLRIKDGDNLLDNTAVHPETYGVVEQMADSLSTPAADLVANAELISSLDLNQFVDDQVGLPTLEDIRDELLKPGRDPRDAFVAPQFRTDVTTLGDLQEGMDLEGVVSNVTNFGAFIDIGVHQDGLVHISELTQRYVRDPREVIQVGQVVRVKVLGVDTALKRISLSMKVLEPPQTRPPAARPSPAKASRRKRKKTTAAKQTRKAQTPVAQETGEAQPPAPMEEKLRALQAHFHGDKST
ncbi:MAG: helix-hairpin-helix domain-containing protein, partial [Candidatus Tectomicrobia bacterium]